MDETLSALHEALGGHTRKTLGDGTGIVLDLKGRRVLVLNETAVCLLEAVAEGVVTGEGLVQRLGERFEVDGERAWGDVEAFVGEMAGYLVGEGGG